MANIGVIGAGTWGTALAVLLCDNGHQVTLWSYNKSQVLQLKETRRNEKLSQIVLPDSMEFTADIKEAVREKDLIVMAVPSTATRSTARKMKEYLPAGQYVISVSKGIEEETLYTQCDILQDELDNAIVGTLSGPSHAEEVIHKLPTVVVAAAYDRKLAVFMQETFMNDSFRVYVSPDVLGVEIGASLKNVIALAAGMSDGLGFGDNAKAALITRGVKEINQLAVAMGGKEATLNGLAGIGDLIVTCSSKHSRNRLAGFYIGKGDSFEEAKEKVNMVVEGVYSAKAALALGNKYHVDLPIIEQVNLVLFEQKEARRAVLDLMTREKKKELDDLQW